MTEVIRGDQEQALRELYALLVHTSSTHAGFEFAILPWGDRNFQDNLAPHGWFAAEYRTLLRTMLVREAGEEGGQLHLLSIVSPQWIGKGKEIAVSNAPTWFGKAAFRLTQPAENEVVLALAPNFDPGRAPKQIVVHLPWFMNVRGVTVDGKPVHPAGGTLVVAPNAKEIHWRWAVRSGAPHMSYDRAVADYKTEYARRYEELMHGAAK
jgi:hypothetical protein